MSYFGPYFANYFGPYFGPSKVDYVEDLTDTVTVVEDINGHRLFGVDIPDTWEFGHGHAGPPPGLEFAEIGITYHGREVSIHETHSVAETLAAILKAIVVRSEAESLSDGIATMQAMLQALTDEDLLTELLSGGVTHIVGPAETITSTGTMTGQLGLIVNEPVSVTSSDAITAVVSIAKSVSESVVITELLSAILALIVNHPVSVDLTEAIVAQVEHVISAADAESLGEAVAAIYHAAQTLSQTSAVVESVIASQPYFADVSESSSLAESLAVIADFVQEFLEQFDVTDQLRIVAITAAIHSHLIGSIVEMRAAIDFSSLDPTTTAEDKHAGSNVLSPTSLQRRPVQVSRLPTTLMTLVTVSEHITNSTDETTNTTTDTAQMNTAITEEDR